MQLPAVGITAVFFVIFPSSQRRGTLMKQPVLGIVATIIVIAVSLTLISFFDFPTFAGWISYSLMCLIPMQIVVGVTWGTHHPGFAAKQRQPLKGILLAITTAVIGAIVLAASLAVAGGNVTPPAPMLVHVTITSVVVTFWGAIIFDLWPLTTFSGVMRQPLLGIVWTVVALAIGGLAFWFGVGIMKMDVMAFLVTAPVPFIFGSIVVINMLQNSLFGKLAQPLKGLANVIAVIVIGSALGQVYRALAPAISGTLHAGPPAYELEIWTASALLAVTFPFLIFYAEFFKFWPLSKRE